LLLGTAAAYGRGNWNPRTYPNPVLDPLACGRRVPQSWVCDPDHLLSHESADVVEGLIKLINQGEDPYARAYCGSAGMVGYQVGVAVMQSFEPEWHRDAARTAETFAKALHDRWGVGRRECNNGVLLFISIDDRQIYISTGSGTLDRLTNTVLDNIINDVKPLLRQTRYSDAVERAVADIGLSLAGKYVRPEEGGGSAGLLIPLIFFALVGVCIYFAVKVSRRQQADYNNCRAKLEKLKRDQERLQQGGSYNPTSCPVCLEDFDVPVGDPNAATAGSSESESSPLLGLRARMHARQPGGASSSSSSSTGPSSSSTGPAQPPPRLRRPLVLPCRHTFCEPCITEWVNQNRSSCPVCRKPIDENDTTPSAPPPPGPCNAEYPAMGGVGSTFGAGPPPQGGFTQTAYPHPGGVGAGVNLGPGIGMNFGNQFGPTPGYYSGMNYGPYYNNYDPFYSAYNGPYYGYNDARYRNRGYTREDMLRDELLFRLGAMRRRYPQYVDDHLVRRWNDDLVHGRPLDANAWRDFQLRDPQVRAEMARSGASGSSSNFGGGNTDGGGGRGSSW